MSSKFNKTLIASALALSATTVMATNPPSESAGSDQTGMDYDAATSTGQAAGTQGTSLDGNRSADTILGNQGNTQSGDQAATSQASTQIHPTLSAKRVDELEGMAVHNQNGDDIGRVDKVVRDANTQQLFAIVSVGGVLSMGDKMIPMALSDLELGDDALIAPTSKEDNQIEQERAAYVEDNYQEFDTEQTLGELSATSATASSDFGQVDRNGDGYIGRDEVGDDRTLQDRWNAIDKNNDQRIDRSEFSALEKRSDS